MKKALSLALALAMCLGLTVPAFADGNPGDTTVTDANGITYQLSNPIITVEQQVEINKAGVETCDAYIVPDGTTVIPLCPDGYVLGEYSYVDENGDSIRFDNFTVMGIGNIGVTEGITVKTVNPADYGGNPDSRFYNGIFSFLPNGNQATLVFIAENPAPAEPEPTEPDAPAYQVSNWAKDRVALAVETGLAADSLGNDYRVNITRAQFAATAVKLYEAMSGEKVEATGESSFTDTTDPVILQAADMGFVSGVGGGKFSPDALVTREQAAVMLSSVFTKLGGEIPAVESTTFADDGDVAGWARNAVAFMNSNEIVTGVGNNSFSPKGNASIEQALLISLKMFETLK